MSRDILELEKTLLYQVDPSVKRFQVIFALAFVGFRKTFGKDRDLCELFLRIMVEANKGRNELLLR
ncbi:MAG: hypothetical protein DRN04_01230 [Thermoprotei archaeon]|nr:MAG: hypothetical protein DRN04_01230 [Thermoprotei archaeon]